MGDLGTSSEANQTTINNQVGVQGGVGLGAGSIGNRIEYTDYRSVQAATQLGSNAVLGNTSVSLAAINGANITTNRALESLQSIGGLFAGIAKSATDSNSQIAAQAAPVSEGNIIQSANHDAHVIAYVAIGGAILLAMYYISHK